jgi:hypothetical protein
MGWDGKRKSRRRRRRRRGKNMALTIVDNDSTHVLARF